MTNNLDLENRIFYVFVFFILLFLSLVWADTNGVWNNAEDLRQGIIGEDEQEDPSGFGYAFINDLTINSDFFVNGNISIFGVNIYDIFQRRIDNSKCSEGYVINKIYENGSVLCVLDEVNDSDSDPNNEKPIAGTGIIVNDRTVSVDTSEIQKRVASSCSAGSSIRSIGEDGSVVCETDDEGGYSGTLTMDLDTTCENCKDYLIARFCIGSSCSSYDKGPAVGDCYCPDDDNDESKEDLLFKKVLDLRKISYLDLIDRNKKDGKII